MTVKVGSSPRMLLRKAVMFARKGESISTRRLAMDPKPRRTMFFPHSERDAARRRFHSSEPFAVWVRRASGRLRACASINEKTCSAQASA